MTAEQIEMAKALRSVVYPIGSFQKRYGRWLSLQAQTNPDRELTERQDAWLRWLVYRYRRQLPKRVVRYACRRLPGGSKPNLHPNTPPRRRQGPQDARTRRGRESHHHTIESR